MADDKRVELRKTLRDAIKYREIIKGFTGHPDDVKALGLVIVSDPEREPGTRNDRIGVEAMAVLEDANEAVCEATRALVSELGRRGYPTIERGHQRDDPSGLAALHAHIQSEADSKRRRIRFTASKDDVKIFEPKGK